MFKYPSFITIKFHIAKTLIFILLKLLNFNTLKESIKPKSTSSLPYKKLQIDQPLPIIVHPKKYDFQKLLEEYQNSHGNLYIEEKLQL